MAADRLHLAVSLLGGLSCRERRLVAECVGSEEILFRLNKPAIEAMAGRRLRGNVLPQDWERRSDRIVSLCAACRCTPLHYWDRRYPPQLREIYDPPFLLYLRGEIPRGDLPFAAVGGTRKPTEKARQAAFRLGAELALAGVPVVSGLARGIDGAAHWGAVKTGGISIAVEATGVDRVYPIRHRELASRILENGGALLSEYPPETELRPFRFPERNRLISGLARTVVVVQAPQRSGALITADYALEQGRDLLVHREGLQGPLGAGGRKLFEDGAEAIGEAREVIRDWDFDRDTGNTALQPLSVEERPTTELLEEELEGRIVRFGAEKYRRVG